MIASPDIQFRDRDLNAIFWSLKELRDELESCKCMKSNIRRSLKDTLSPNNGLFGDTLSLNNR